MTMFAYRLKILFLSFFIIFATDSIPASLGQEIRPASTTTRGLESKFNTIAHEILAMEAAVSSVSTDMFALLDSFIEEALARVKLPKNYNRNDVLTALKEIDDILVERNVVYPADLTKMELVQQLSDGLRGRKLNSAEVNALAKNRHNVRRKNRILARASETFYINDCDTTTYIYLAIAEVLEIPLFMVEIPGHNFVRFDDGNIRIDWETMDGIPIAPGQYERTWRLSDDLVQRRIYMVSMSRKDLIGYHFSITASLWGRKKFDRRAASDLHKSVALNPRQPIAWNNLAWSLVVSPDPSERDGHKAIEYAQKAISLSRTPNVMDTLACAYAEIGNFQEAIRVELDARRLALSGNHPVERVSPDFDEMIRRFRSNRTCVDETADRAVAEANTLLGIRSREFGSLRKKKYSLGHLSHLLSQ